MTRRILHPGFWLLLMSRLASADVSVGNRAPGSAQGRPPIADPVRCQTESLRFRPTPGTRYQVSTTQSVPHGLIGPTIAPIHRSTIVFSQHGGDGEGTRLRWLAVESDFFGAPLATGSDARLTWVLDERGVPVGVPTMSGSGDPEAVRSLSLFAFRPFGLVLRSTCAGATGTAKVTDAAKDLRSYSFRVTGGDGRSLTLAIAGSVQSAAGEGPGSRKVRSRSTSPTD